MNTLTSALNYGALIALSCCNAALQIAAAPSCSDAASDSGWPSCAADGAVAGADLRNRLFRPGQVTRIVVAEGAGGGANQPDRLVASFHGDGRLEGSLGGGGNVGRHWRIDGDRVCLKFDPSFRSQPECSAVEVARGKLYLVEGNDRKAVDRIEWAGR